jgi:stearoyl-CoA desaturase (delta-9 desaturase)
MKPTPLTLLIGQTIAQLSVIPMFFIGTTTTMTFGITMGYHRYWSHYSFKCSKTLEYVMMFFAHIMMVGPALAWVAQHREHHDHADTEKDPHSPKYRGFIRCYYSQVMSLPKMKYAKDLLKNDLCKFQHRMYWQALLAYGTTLFLLDPFAIIYAWLAPAGFAKLIGSFVFIYSHRGGKPRSDYLLGLVTFGEGFHEKHHVEPWSWDFHRWDIGGKIIKLLKHA